MNIIEGDSIPLLLNLLVWLILFFMFRPLLFKQDLEHRMNSLFPELIVILFCVFAVWGADWFHYQESFRYQFNDSTEEEIYRDIVPYFSNYLVFRLVLWGGFFLLLKAAFKGLTTNYNVLLAIFCVGPLIWYSYARVSFAMVLLLWGLIKTTSYKKRVSIILGIAAIAAAYFFHKSALFGIAVALLSLAFVNFKPKFSIAIAILSIPVVFFFVKNFFLFYMSELALEESTIGEYAQGGMYYADDDTVRVAGISEFILNFLEHAPIFVGAFLCLKIITIEKNCDKSIKAISFYVVLVTLLASVFAFDLGFTSSTIYGRLLRFAHIPLVVPAAYCFEEKKFPKLTKIFLYLVIASSFSRVLYSLYCVLV